jgi:hypothetical protein
MQQHCSGMWGTRTGNARMLQEALATLPLSPAAQLGPVGPRPPAAAARSEVRPHSMVSHAAWYPARHGIPHSMVSHVAWYPVHSCAIEEGTGRSVLFGLVACCMFSLHVACFCCMLFAVVCCMYRASLSCAARRTFVGWRYAATCGLHELRVFCASIVVSLALRPAAWSIACCIAARGLCCRRRGTCLHSARLCRAAVGLSPSLRGEATAERA